MVQIFVTGGTFDKQYDYLSGKLQFTETHLPHLLSRGRCTLDVDVDTLMMLDSLNMEPHHYAQIVAACRNVVHDKILLTHGTDRMVETATKLAEAALPQKTIVLTGAMVPYAFGTSSDGFFNLGSALAFVQILTPGVYIVMNGLYFNWNNVKKNKTTGYFEVID